MRNNTLSTYNINLKDIGLTFDSVNHIHYILKDIVPGCTTVTHIYPKEWMESWVAKATTNYILGELSRYKVSEKISIAEVSDIVREGKLASKRTSDEGKSIGTTVHEWIERYILQQMNPIVLVRNPMPEHPKAVHCITQFIKWTKEHTIVWLASELQVGSALHMFAGILDFLAIIDGVFTLGDFKTSSNIFDEHYIQTAGLQYALAEQGCGLVQQRVILNVPKSGDLFRYEVVPTSYEKDVELFLAFLSVCKLLRERK